MVRNLRAGTVDAFLVGRYLAVAGPAAIAGVVVSTRVSVPWLVLGFAAFVLAYGGSLVIEHFRAGDRKRCQPHRRIFWPVGALAGFLQGAIATGARAPF